MVEKRFFINGNMVIDGENIIPSTMWQYEEQQKKYCDELNKLNEENQELKELIKLIAHADSYPAEESVKETIRHKIRGLDSVSGEFAGAWNDYVILSKFFKEYYGENWDNYD